MTDPATPPDVPEADRAEEEALVDPQQVTSPGEWVPEADSIDQQLDASPGAVAARPRPVGDREADDADVLEQETDVPLDDDEPV